MSRFGGSYWVAQLSLQFQCCLEMVFFDHCVCRSVTLLHSSIRTVEPYPPVPRSFAPPIIPSIQEGARIHCVTLQDTLNAQVRDTRDPSTFEQCGQLSFSVAQLGPEKRVSPGVDRTQ
jgi:hypothetical protein